MKKLCNILKVIYFTLTILFLLWIAISYIDVVSHNLTPNYQYSNWNLFYYTFEILAN